MSGNRGIRQEMWNTSEEYGQSFIDLLVYDTDGYVSFMEDFSFESADYSRNQFVSRFKGYFVPPADGYYQFLIRSDDDSELFFSGTGYPWDKVSLFPIEQSATVR